MAFRKFPAPPSPLPDAGAVPRRGSRAFLPLLASGMLGAVVLAESCVVVMSLLLHGMVRDDFLLTGLVTAVIASALILPVIIRFALRLEDQQTQLREAREREASEEKYRIVADNTYEWEFWADPQGRYLYVSPACERISGQPAAAYLADPSLFVRLLHPNDFARYQEHHRRTFEQRETAEIELRLRRPDGSHAWIAQRCRPVQDAAGRHIGVRGSNRDITASKLASEQVEFLAYHDGLTGLPNRLLARDRVAMAVAGAERHRLKAALLFIDVDHFKGINDSLGHSAGDSVLRGLAELLRASLRETDTASRLAGDEFLVVLANVANLEQVGSIAGKLLRQAREAQWVEGHEIPVSLSIGVCLCPDDGREFDELLKKADTALYHAKEAGRNAFRFYTDRMNVDAQEGLRVRAGLARALETEALVLHYQPQFDLRSGRLLGAEALLRWNDPLLGLVTPDRFVQVAERSGLIVPIGAWVLQQACRQARGWQDQGLAGLRVAVNLSPVQFRRGDLESVIARALADSGLPATALELEFTESTLMQHHEGLLASMRSLKAQGIRLAIDDFGTGYSSFAYLKRFKVDRLKIDRSFIARLDHAEDDFAIVRAMVQMAHNLQLEVLAEGVESPAVLQRLKELQCDQAQGFCLGMPMPAEDFERFARACLAGSTPPAGLYQLSGAMR